MVSALDDATGALYKALLDTGMLSNSVIVFTTDNGGPANRFDYNAASNWPLRGMKWTLWEGGVRGMAFIYSQLLQKSAYTSENLIHVCDWLPTLYSAAGGHTSSLPPSDGLDLWKMLSTQGPPERNEVLHNIDPIDDFGALRQGGFKLVYGDVSNHGWGGWYPSWQKEHDDQLESGKIGAQMPNVYGTRHGSILGPVVVECGKKPENASTNCNSTSMLCLYHIPSDPCEYNNIASSYPTVLLEMMARIEYLSSTAVTPGNKPVDPKGNPRNYGGFWVPWL